jgi:uncharacterized protein YdhG (YjbR/CyaY superfamily)
MEKNGFLTLLAAPARRALESAGIRTLKQLSAYSEESLLQLHGLGKNTIPKLKAALADEGLTLKEIKNRKVLTTPGTERNGVDKYILGFPEEVQEIMQQLRKLVKHIAPEAEEGIAYGMPAYKMNKRPLIYFAAYKQHIGFYATPSGHSKFTKELSKYKQGKGSVQFPLDEPMPYKLIERIVKFRVEENEMR